MWINDLHVTINVDNQPFADLALSSLLAVRRTGFFPYPRVEKCVNSQECGGAFLPRNAASPCLELVWKTDLAMTPNNLRHPAHAV
jgi:hypothetical protein